MSNSADFIVQDPLVIEWELLPYKFTVDDVYDDYGRLKECVMETNVNPNSPTRDERISAGRALLFSQFYFYQRLVAKKHNYVTVTELDPKAMTDTELEQAVAFLKDAAHLPPG